MSMKSSPELPLGFDEKPKPGMRILQKIKELVRKVTQDKVSEYSAKLVLNWNLFNLK